MVMIKFLDKGPFYYHQYEKRLTISKDEFGEWIMEKPDKSWLLPYTPIYITTDEEWLIKNLKKYAESAFEMVDIISDDEKYFFCSIPQEELKICIPSKERIIENKLPHIPNKLLAYASDGYLLGEEKEKYVLKAKVVKENGTVWYSK